jgi:hypothetical protein
MVNLLAVEGLFWSYYWPPDDRSAFGPPEEPPSYWFSEDFAY